MIPWNSLRLGNPQINAIRSKMGKTRGVHETTPELRNRMVGMYEAGLGLREIAAAVNCSQRTVKRWLNRFDKEGTVETRERCGRKRVTTAEQDEAIIQLATQTPITAAKAVLPALGLTCSVDTIRERLHKAGIHNWSPSRKYMQRIPLGDTDGATIQQPMWRPTGTQLGKKKSSKCSSSKEEKNSGVAKKKNPPRKIRAKDLYVGDGAPMEHVKSSSERQNFAYTREIASESYASKTQTASQTLHQGQTGFDNGTTLPHETESPIYSEHSGLSMAEAWPLDLVQGTPHYSQNQSNSTSQEQANSTHPDLHSQQQEVQSKQLQHHMQHAEQTIMNQTHDLEQQQEHLETELRQQHQQDRLNPQLVASQTSTSLPSNCSNVCVSQDNNQSSSMESDRNSGTPKDGCIKNQAERMKKKGGKAKGTLETSVEIRNRMIGMSEAGLSTLSIALAIDRSERTVKRWLERWHKEGNVQTKERKGRRRITTKEQDDAIIAMATQQPLTAAKYVAPALGLQCSVDTIRERLHKAGIHSWKLGKKQGEGNAVHTVHLWQPSGNRPNKPKLSGEKRKKLSGNRKRDQTLINTQKRLTPRRRRTESISVKVIQPPASVLSEQTATMLQNSSTMANCVSGSNVIQPVHNIAASSSAIIQQSQSHPSLGASQAPHSIQSMQQRPDCRLAPPIVAPVSIQGNAAVAYPSCMVVATNNPAGNVEQSDPLSYEPYIWTF